jgi:hypothetical protein
MITLQTYKITFRVSVSLMMMVSVVTSITHSEKSEDD